MMMFGCLFDEIKIYIVVVSFDDFFQLRLHRVIQTVERIQPEQSKKNFLAN